MSVTNTVANTVANSESISVDVEVDVEVDARGMKCPMPLLKTKLALHELPLGKILKLSVTDEGARIDVPAYLQMTGHRLLKTNIGPDGDQFWIQKN